MSIEEIIICMIDAYIIFSATVAWLDDIDAREFQNEFLPITCLSKGEMFCYKIVVGIKYGIIALIIIIVANYLLQIMLA